MSAGRLVLLGVIVGGILGGAAALPAALLAPTAHRPDLPAAVLAGACALLVLVLVLLPGRRMRRFSVGVALPLALTGSMLAVSAADSVHAAAEPTATPTPTRVLPAHGRTESVAIPATVSHFDARHAFVYLPPAALVDSPRRLPVVIALSGQSRRAGPIDVVRQGHLAAIMDAIAAAHHGVAPVVVVPDQLGPASGNPMCVDSRLGHVHTYITVDVRRWILRTLPVSAARRQWTIAGFSEGGTCAIQFGAGDPAIFGSLIDVSGEEAPVNGSLAHTIAVGFGGSRAAYERATPFRLLAAHRYPPTRALFAVGALDHHYGPVAPIMAAHARAAGMSTSVRVLPGLAHNWRTGGAGLAWGLNALTSWWGI